MPQKLETTEVYKQKVFAKRGDKVEILGEYKGGTKPIYFIYHCEKHGDTYKTLNAKNILSKSFQPCKECDREKKSKSGKGKKIKDKEFYYDRLKKYVEGKGGKLHSTKWTFAKDLYEIECENGHIFHANADSLVNKPQWCPYCCGRVGDFEKEISDIAKSKNGVILSKYSNTTTHVRAKCLTHNYEWDIMPLNIKKGRWCPVCNLPYSEKVVYDYLTNKGYNIKLQYSFNDLKSENDEFLRYDFAILDKSDDIIFLLEVDDNEHRYNTKQPRRIKARERDRMKDAYCLKNNINFYRMVYINNNDDFLNYDWYYSYIQKKFSTYILDSKVS